MTWSFKSKVESALTVLLDGWRKVQQQNEEIKMALDDMKARLDAFDAQLTKIGAEISAEVQGLKDQIATLQGQIVTAQDVADLNAKLDSIGGKIQGLDDLNPDA